MHAVDAAAHERTRELPAKSSTSSVPATPLEALEASLADVRRAIAEPLALLGSLAPWAGAVVRDPRVVRKTIRRSRRCSRSCRASPGSPRDSARALARLDELAASGEDPSVRRWAAGIAEGIREARPRCVELLARLRLNADIAREMWEHTDFSMLYDPHRQLFSIGYNLNEGRLDPSYYDLLASECRLASFLAIAKGDVPQEHWFRLGRALTKTREGPRAGELERVDVRVPDAAAGHARLAEHPARRDVRHRRARPDRLRPRAAASRGA